MGYSKLKENVLYVFLFYLHQHVIRYIFLKYISSYKCMVLYDVSIVLMYCQCEDL